MCYVCVALVEGCKAGLSHIVSSGVIEFKRGEGGGVCARYTLHMGFEAAASLAPHQEVHHEHFIHLFVVAYQSPLSTVLGSG